VLVGTLAYLFLDHRNARTGFGGNEGIFVWVGWIVTQPVTFLFAIPAIGMLAELAPVVFGRRTPVRGVLLGGLALIGMAALAGVTQQNIQNLPWSGSQLNVDDLETKVRDLVPFLLFNALPVLGMLLVLMVVLQTARPGEGTRFKFSPAILFAFFGFGMVLVGMLGNLLHAADDLDLQGTVFEEANLIYVVYGGVLAAMGATIHWAPKLWGATLDAGKVLPLALLGLTGTILAAFPMYIAGFLNQPAGLSYLDDDLVIWNVIALVGHAFMAVTVLGFIGLVLLSTRHDDPVADDPWDVQRGIQRREQRLMHALPAAPAPAPQRQMLVGASLAVVAMVMLTGSMLAVWALQRREAIDTTGTWVPDGTTIPEVPTNVILIAFVGICVFGQWAVWSAKRNDRPHTVLALGCTGLVALLVINAQAFVYHRMGLGVGDGTYAAMFYAITGMFMVLMIIGLLFTVVAAVRYIGGRAGVQGILVSHAIYWYAMSAIYAAIWFLVYVTK
jgi:heme/copper-type cytochrome/quinol oxidase subunit 3